MDIPTDQRRLYELFDQELRDINWRAPPPTLGQSPDDYARETCRLLKRKYLPQTHDLYKINYRGLRADALYSFVPQLLQAVKKEAVNPNNFEPGEIRMIPKVDPVTGVRSNEFYGRDHFTKFMGRPGRRVTSFTTSNGRYDAAKGKYF